MTAVNADKDRIAKQIADLESEIQRRRKAANKIDPEDRFIAFKLNLMLWPIVDGFNSPEKSCKTGCLC